MTSIPAVLFRNCSNNFKCHYLRNQRLFLDFLLHFWNLHQISSIFKEKMNLLAELFPKLLTLKDVATSTSKRSCFRTSFGKNLLTGSKHCWNEHGTPLIRLGYSSFSWKCSKFHACFRNAIKNPEKVFCFWDNGVWNCCSKFFILLLEYLSSEFNAWTKSLKISYQTESDFFQLNLTRIEEKRG